MKGEFRGGLQSPLVMGVISVVGGGVVVFLVVALLMGAFTKFFGHGAIYGITPTDEATMLAAAGSLHARPVSLYIPTERQLPQPEQERYEDDEELGW